MNEILKIIEEIKEFERRREPERILELLSHPSFIVRERACKAIIRTGRYLKDEILELLEKGFWYEKASALEILSEWAGEEEINIFLKYLKSDNTLIKEKAALGILKILKKLPALPQNFNPEILKELYELFMGLQKSEYAREIKKNYKEFFK